MDTFDKWVLSLATFVPVAGAFVILAIPKKNEGGIKLLALVASLVSLGFGLAALAKFDFGRPGMQLVVNNKWITAVNARYHVGIDGISMPLFVLTLVITTLCIIYSWNHFPEPHNPKMFLFLVLLLETGMLGTFVALDLILFFVFFEVVLLPMYFMIGIWGGPRRQYASIKFFLFTLFGSAFMLIGFLALYFKSQPNTFDMLALANGAAANISRTAGLIIFGGLFLGFAIKVPMWPVHTWLPDAHTEAPTVGSVLLAAILLKLGTYGFVRISLPVLPDAARSWAPWIGLLAVIGIIYGSLCCLAQKDLKRMIAFSSVGHMGFVMLGIATLTPTGINAAIFGMVAHGIITGMLFFVAGSLQERYQTREMSELGGVLNSMPRLGGVLVFVSFASLGLPALAGFPGEFTAMLAAFQPAKGLDVNLFRGYMVAAGIGTVLTAGYFLWMLQRVAQGPIPERWQSWSGIHDVSGIEYTAWAPLLVATLAVGIYPALVFGLTDSSVTQLIGKAFGT